jgi:hypothetical protein
MTFGGLHYQGVFVAAVASFVFGALYYMALSKPWMEALGKQAHDARFGVSRTAFSVTALCELVMAYVLAGVLGHLGPRQVTVENGVITGLFLWVGFVATTLIVSYRYQGQKSALVWIDGGHWLGVLLIQGLVIGLFGNP